MNRSEFPGYEAVIDAFEMAVADAARGKGRARHAAGAVRFEAQPMMQITRMVGVGFPLGQAQKKAQEAALFSGLDDRQAARIEILGAMVYLAGAYIALGDPGAADDPCMAGWCVQAGDE